MRRRRLWRPAAVLAVPAAVAAAMLLAAPSSGKAPDGLLDISSIRATFTGCPSGGPFPPDPPECATKYSVQILDAPPGAVKNLRFEWFLELKLIDQEGAPEPGNPGSGANFDPSCVNAELPKGTVVEGAAGASGVIYHWEGKKSDFVWYHGDAGVYSDNPTYGCDHTKMGPSGHQGVITVLVDDAAPDAKYPVWVCQGNYYGTNDGVAPSADTDCHPEASDPGQRFLVSVAFQDELTARHMLMSKHNLKGAKAELEHSLSDLKSALGQEKRYPLPDPYWVRTLQKAIQDDDAALNADPPNGRRAIDAVERALDAKDALLEDSSDDDGDAPPPRLLPFFPGK